MCFRVGPLDGDTEYSVDGEKEGHVLTAIPDRPRHFKAFKLAEISVIVSLGATQHCTQRSSQWQACWHGQAGEPLDFAEPIILAVVNVDMSNSLYPGGEYVAYRNIF